MLKLADARRIIDTAEKKAKEIGQPMNIAVVDEGANLISHIRMDGAWIGSAFIATTEATPPVEGTKDLIVASDGADTVWTRAYDILHPDLLSSGGMLETKRIAEEGEVQGMPTALHCAGSPITLLWNLFFGRCSFGAAFCSFSIRTEYFRLVDRPVDLR